MKPWLLLAGLLIALSTGCPDPAKTDTTDKTTKTEKTAKTDADDDPLKGSLFSEADLFAVYAASMKRDSDPAVYRKVLTAHRLLDADGKVNHARTEAYDRALGRYAKKAPEKWAKFNESLGQPKTTKTAKTE